MYLFRTIIRLKQTNELSVAHCNCSIKVCTCSMKVPWMRHKEGKHYLLKTIDAKAAFSFTVYLFVLSFAFAVCDDHCGKNIACYFDSPNPDPAKGDSIKCCDRQCLGGCTGQGPDKCIACKSVFASGYCKEYCTQTTYKVTIVYHKQVKSKIGKMSQIPKNRAWPFEFVLLFSPGIYKCQVGLSDEMIVNYVLPLSLWSSVKTNNPIFGSKKTSLFFFSDFVPCFFFVSTFFLQNSKLLNIVCNLNKTLCKRCWRDIGLFLHCHSETKLFLVAKFHGESINLKQRRWQVFLVFATGIVLLTRYNWILSRDSGKRNITCRKKIVLCCMILFEDIEPN